jgi:hypothetical protein
MHDEVVLTETTLACPGKECIKLGQTKPPVRECIKLGQTKPCSSKAVMMGTFVGGDDLKEVFDVPFGNSERGS